MSLDGNMRHPLADRGHDLYETPGCAVRALLSVEWLPRRVWEPACGPGSIVRELRAAGHIVVASDIVDYGLPGQIQRDFLATSIPYADTIVTNPPFKHATAFARRALALCPRVVMLLRHAYLEGTTRGDVLDDAHLARVHVFRKRLPMMHRHGWTGPISSSRTAFSWYVWDRSCRSPTQVHRLSWEPFADQPMREAAE